MNLFLTASAQQLVATCCHACNQLSCITACKTSQVSSCTCWVITRSVGRQCARAMSGCLELCDHAMAGAEALAPLISQHVSTPTHVPSSLILNGHSSHSSSASGVSVPGIDEAYGSEPFTVLPGVQQHCPQPRVELGHWLCSCYRSCALRGLCMRAWGVQSGRKSRAPQAGCPNLQGVAGKAAAAPPPRVQPPTRPSSSQAASAAAVIPGATAQLGRPGVVAACEYKAGTSGHQDCRLVLRLMHDATVIGCYGRGSLLLKLFRQSCHTAARLWHLFL